jgi:hypothetical protein
MPAEHPSSSAGGTKLYYYHSHPVGVHDVICGKKCERHPGNVAFRHIVRLHQRQYQSTNTREVKKRIIENIIERVTVNNGGRFVKENDDHTGMEPVPPPYVYEKVSHVLRSTTRSSSPCFSPTSSSHPSSTRTMMEEEEKKKEQKKAAATGVFDDLLAAQQKLFYSYLMASSSSSSTSASSTTNDDNELEQCDDGDQWSVSSSEATLPTTTKQHYRMIQQQPQQPFDRCNGMLVDPTTMSVLLGLVHDDDVIGM